MIISIAVVLFIAYLIYLEPINGHPSISAEVTGPAEVQLGDQFTYNVTVTNTGDRDLSNVSVSDSYGFRWNGSLPVNESRTFSIEFSGSTAGEVINEVHVDGYTEKGRHVWDQASWTVVMTRERYDLLDAVDEGLVDAEFSGTGDCGGEVIKLKITPKLNVSIEIKITSGFILINSGSGQNMIVAETCYLAVGPEIEFNLDIEAYCLDLHKDNPSSKETFSIQTDPGTYGEDVVRLMKSLEDISFRESRVSSSAIQIALWVIKDDVSEEDIRIDYSTEDIEDAKWLLENAGIDTSGKKLFQKG